MDRRGSRSLARRVSPEGGLRFDDGAREGRHAARLERQERRDNRLAAGQHLDDHFRVEENPC